MFKRSASSVLPLGRYRASSEANNRDWSIGAEDLWLDPGSYIVVPLAFAHYNLSDAPQNQVIRFDLIIDPDSIWPDLIQII